MKAKKGICTDCGEGSKEKYLTAGRCEPHYKRHRAKVCAAKPKAKDKKIFKAELNVFFASQILEIPTKCENCPNDIRYWKQVDPRRLVAHILPKRPVGGFPTVAIHPKNRLFLCPDCHTNFDNKGEDFAVNMEALPIIIERFQEFKHLLTESEMQRIPSYLK